MHHHFPNAYFTTHESFPLGLLALQHLSSRNCAILPALVGDEPPSVSAVTLFPWYTSGIKGFLRIVPPKNRIVRSEHSTMQEYAGTLPWIGHTATLVAVNMSRTTGGLVNKNELSRFFDALDNLCGYRRWTPEQQKVRNHAKRRALAHKECRSCEWELE